MEHFYDVWQIPTETSCIYISLVDIVTRLWAGQKTTGIKKSSILEDVQNHSEVH